MKLAILADIHGNYQALHTVVDHLERWQPDAVVVAGDVVNRGPRSAECLQLIQRKQAAEGWLTVRGNHEDYVIAYDVDNSQISDVEFEIFRVAYWAYQQLNGQVQPLRAMPFQVSLTAPDGGEVRVTHASMISNRNGIFPKTSNKELRQKIKAPHQPPPALFCVGHTHVPLIRRLDDTLIVNVGAVGLPFDGDPRAAYAQLAWQQGRWQANIVRLHYDRGQAEQDFFDTGFFDEAGPIAQLVLDELRTAQSCLYQWTKEYEAQTLAGCLSLQEAVTNFLIDKHGHVPAWTPQLK